MPSRRQQTGKASALGAPPALRLEAHRLAPPAGHDDRGDEGPFRGKRVRHVLGDRASLEHLLDGLELDGLVVLPKADEVADLASRAYAHPVDRPIGALHAAEALVDELPVLV